MGDEQFWNSIRNIGSEISLGESAMRTFSQEDFSNLLGIPEWEFSENAKSVIERENFMYRLLSPEEREELMVDVSTAIFVDKLTVSGPEKHAVWEKGWNENLQAFSKSGDPSELTPKFVRKGVPKRVNGMYILPACDNFESNFVRVMREVLFKKYFSNIDSLYEFGCGTGNNLLAAAEILPGVKFHGLDWSSSSIKLVKKIAEIKNLDIQAHLFDMFQPDVTLPLKHNDGVLTIGSLEQLGPNFINFLNFIIQKSPSICLHFETMNEIYDRKTLPDFLAIEYSKARNYLQGFLTELKKLEANGKVKILQVQRVFGSQFHEGYSFVAWAPIDGHSKL